MAAPITTSANDPYERLIAQTIQLERRPQLELKQKRGEEKRLKAVLDDFDSRLSTLYGQLEGLTDPVANPFEGRSAELASETSAFSVSADDTAGLGTHTLKVDRLASADGRFSKQYAASGTALRGFFDANGAQTFSIGVASPTDADPDARSQISVTVDPTGTTDAEIMDEIRSAINDAMDTAVENETITSGERASASVVRETSDTARLSVRSGSTGYAGRLTFTDSANGLLNQLEVTADQVAAGTSGGQVTDVGTGEQDSALNSKFVLDGLTLYRSSNRVTDALDGLTLNLQEAGEPAVSFEVKTDSEGITGEVESFIKKYNAVLDFIRKKASVDAEAGTRGDFASERAFKSLRFNLRNDIAQPVSGLPDGAARTLRDLGIETSEDGTLNLDDEDALQAAVADNPNAVRQLFAGEEGVATRVRQRVDRFVETGGVIDTRQDSLDASVRRLDDRIDRFDDQLARREEQLRARFAEVQKTIQALQSQQQRIGFF